MPRSELTIPNGDEPQYFLFPATQQANCRPLSVAVRPGLSPYHGRNYATRHREAAIRATPGQIDLGSSNKQSECILLERVAIILSILGKRWHAPLTSLLIRFKDEM